MVASTLVMPATASSASLAGADQSVLIRPPQVQPGDLGDATPMNLHYGDPGAGMLAIAPPAPNNRGTAQLQHPLLIPSGRSLQPNLILEYDSAAASSWVGAGWNLSVGEITIDTRWGVPRYDPQKETETYLLDGQQLSPTAVVSQFAQRVTDRSDFTLRVETAYSLIIRHGDSPKDYWWEVRDKNGGVRWYGGLPDTGGPNAPTIGGASQLDNSAVLRDDSGNIYRWALSAERDVGVNMVRYFYETVPGQRVGASGNTLGRQLYLSRIRYTENASLASGDAAYEVRFLRDAAVGASDLRKDVIVSARGGFPEVTSDLLRRVEVWFGAPNGGAERNYNVLSRAYALRYTQGAFGKSLLSSIDQIGSDGTTYASNKFDYYNDVQDASGTYHGWGPEVTWNTGGDNLQQNVLTPVGTSVLGSSQTTSGDVHAYLGFNPLDPTKIGSFGGSIAVTVGTTEANAEFVDVNGDGLPDKVWHDQSGIWWRKNTSQPNQPGAPVTFGDKNPVVGLNKLSSQVDVGLAGGPEAHIEGIDLQFIISGDVTIGDGYFTDANGDGLPDFVSGGVVYFNHLDPNSGNPTFETTSQNTPAPIDETTTSLPVTQQIKDLEDQRRQQSPLQDTVLRWVAPFDGNIAITAPVTLDPALPGDPTPAPPYTGDGVRVAVQQNAHELWSATLTTPQQTATPGVPNPLVVHAGDHLYFRVQSIDDGARDQVRWDPKIQYTFTAPPDENGLSQSTFQQSQDFTLAGRPHTLGAAPLGGTVHFQGTLHKTKATSDDVTVQVLDNGAAVFSQLVTAATVNAVALTPTDITVKAPTATSQDRLEVRVVVDSPIDVSAVQLDYQLYYTRTDTPGIPLTDASGNPTIALQIPADTTIYPQNTLTAPNTPWVSTVTGNATANFNLTVGAFSGGTDNTVVLTVKRMDPSGVGVRVGKQTISVSPSQSPQPISGTLSNLALVAGASYWFDISIRDPGMSSGAGQQSVQLIAPGNNTLTVPSALNLAGAQGYFPLSYRGWGFAGYNGDGARASQPIDETAFVVNPADFPQNPQGPSGFHDTSYIDASKGPGYAFVPSHIQAVDASGNPLAIPPLNAWRGVKDDIIGAAGLMRSSRTGVDSPSLGVATGGSVRAVERVGIAAPVFSLNAGFGGASATFGVGPSFGLQDYADMNGDGFPSIVGPGYVKYTGPRGGFYDSGAGVSPVNQSTSFAVGGGLSATPVDIKSDSKGNVHSSQPTPSISSSRATNTTTSSAQGGGSAAETQYGFKVGGSVGISATITNPASVDPNVSGAVNTTSNAGGTTPSSTAPFEQTLVDVNGDGLPDLVTQSPQGVFVQFNLGYGFSQSPILWSDGGFETNESYAGSFGPQLGFTTPERDFSAGLGLSESDNIPRFAWVDVNGDGILDRLRSDSNTGQVMVAFGTNSGLLAEVPYGTMESPDAATDPLLVALPTVNGQQIAVDDTKGLGAGFDFTLGIGPLCIAACYLIVNPGVHFDHSVSNTQVELVDVDGSGNPSVVKSTADNQLVVRPSTIGRTNLLQAVHGPMGGTIQLSYQRDGNTTADPTSTWTMSRVEVDDGRPGDAITASTYSYKGAQYNRLERQALGYSSVIENQLADNGNTVVRSIEQTYLNDNVFDSGELARTVLKDASGSPVQETDFTWVMRDLSTLQPVNLTAPANDPANTRLLSMRLGPVETQMDEKWFAVGSTAPAEETLTSLTYDALGNVLTQVDGGQKDVPGDAVTATMQYSGCSASSNLGCPPSTLPGGKPPYWSSTLCKTWVSVPASIAVTNASGQLLRQRNGAPGLCDNASATDQKEWFGTGGSDFVETGLGFDAFGNFNHIAYPRNANGQQATVDYVYDPILGANIQQVTDGHGLSANATYDGRTGEVLSQTDANNQTTTYSYDAFGRVTTITGPYEQGTGHPTVSFEYHAETPGKLYAIAHNFDSQHPNTTIDTAAFIDGIGRPTQKKNNATLFTGANSAATNVMIVSGAMVFDSLGRVVSLRYPVAEPLNRIGLYNTDTSGAQTTISYDVLDRPTQVTVPGGLVTKMAYSFGSFTSKLHAGGFSANLFENTLTDSLGKPRTTVTDVRGNVWAVDDGTPTLHTEYDYDGLGQLLQVRDPGGNVSQYAYDLLGRQTSSNTPDGGLVSNVYDGAGNTIAQVTPNLRAKNEQITYSYDIDRLTSITYPADSGTPNVSYTYGAPGAAGNAAGRVISAADGARTQQFTYDRLGAVTSEVAVMNLHNGPSAPLTTSFTHDGFGRLLSVTYPDGMVLSNSFDSGGLLSSMEGVKGTIITDFMKRQEYDVFQNRAFRQLGNGVQTQYNYDPNTLQLARQVTTTPTRTIQDLNYSYDGVGNVLSLVNNADGPVPNLLGGPSTQTYSYDNYYRLLSARGVAPVAPNKFRDYSYSVSYDASDNLASKNQCDEIVPAVGTTCGAKTAQTVPATTYNWAFTYAPSPTRGPHQIATAGGNAYSYDANGNFTQVVDSKSRLQRAVTWDAANRARNISDVSSSTDYLYDAQGLLGVRRDSQGETAFVNDFYTFTNDGWFWKQIWADNDHIAEATEQVDPLTGALTPLDYYEHKDLQGSVNVVTDQTGAEFEHMEYFPSGEIWIHENSTTHRTPYRFVGEFNDEVRNLDLLGQRWYQPREQGFYSPEPLLTTQGEQTIDDPGLLAAYGYAESNPLRLYDSNGTAPNGVLSRLRGLLSSRAAPQDGFVVERGGRPNTPTITVTYSSNSATGADFGGSARMYISYKKNEQQDAVSYHSIELIGSWQRENGVTVLGSGDQYQFGWPDPERSTTWQVSNDQARQALEYAKTFREREAGYTYNYYGIGADAYNSSKFVEEVLGEVGIQASSGALLSSGEKLVTGQSRATVSYVLSNIKNRVSGGANRLRTRLFGARPQPVIPINQDPVPLRYQV